MNCKKTVLARFLWSLWLSEDGWPSWIKEDWIMEGERKRKQKSSGDQGSGVEKRGEWGRIELSFHLRFSSLLVSTRLAWWNVNLAWSGKQHRRSKIGQRERKERVKNVPSCDSKCTLREMRSEDAHDIYWTQAASWYYGSKKQDE